TDGKTYWSRDGLSVADLENGELAQRRCAVEKRRPPQKYRYLAGCTDVPDFPPSLRNEAGADPAVRLPEIREPGSQKQAAQDDPDHSAGTAAAGVGRSGVDERHLARTGGELLCEQFGGHVFKDPDLATNLTTSHSTEKLVSHSGMYMTMYLPECEMS